MAQITNQFLEQDFYVTSLRFPPHGVDDAQHIGFYSNKELADAVFQCAKNFLIDGDLEVSDVGFKTKGYTSEVIKGLSGYYIKANYALIEERYEENNIHQRIMSLLEGQANNRFFTFSYRVKKITDKPIPEQSGRGKPQEEASAPEYDGELQEIKDRLEKIIGSFETYDEARKNYKKWSLNNHPDKRIDKEAANAEYQNMQEVFNAYEYFVNNSRS